MLREAVGSQNDAILATCPLWYARYSGTDMPIGIPRQVWPTFSLWQYTDGNNGSEPHTADGIGGATETVSWVLKMTCEELGR